MDGLPPPASPALVAATDVCSASVSLADAQVVLKAATAAFPRTTFEAAWPACFPGLVALRMSSGAVAYTDKSARYLVLGLILDSATGKALDRQLDGRLSNSE
jgi:hypothetical protein